jgi:hypothetical protein
VQRDGAAHQHGLEQLTLDLLHADDHEQHEQRGDRPAVREGDEHRDETADERADDRHERAEEHQERERQDQRHAAAAPGRRRSARSRRSR